MACCSHVDHLIGGEWIILCTMIGYVRRLTISTPGSSILHYQPLSSPFGRAFILSLFHNFASRTKILFADVRADANAL